MSTIYGASVTSSTDQIIPPGIETVLKFDVEEYNYGGLHDQTHPSRLTAKVPDGIYLLTGTVFFKDGLDAPGGRMVLEFQRNGDEQQDLANAQQVVNPGWAAFTVSALVKLKRGEYVELKAYHECGISRTAWKQYNRFAMQLLVETPHRLGIDQIVK